MNHKLRNCRLKIKAIQLRHLLTLPIVVLMLLTSSTTQATKDAGQVEWNKFYKYMSRSVRYTNEAIKARVQGYSQIKFRIKSDGVQDLSVVGNPLGYGLDEAFMKAVSEFDGYQDLPNGKYSLIFSFGLQGLEDNGPPPGEVKGYKSLGGSLSTTANPNYLSGTHKNIGEDNRIYDFASIETQPSFPGGPKGFNNYIKKEMNYSGDARGKVFLSFIVEKDGSLTGIRVERRLGYGADEEAVRLLKNSPKWSPGVQSGKIIRVKYNIPMDFGM
jgi:TonB family protein